MRAACFVAAVIVPTLAFAEDLVGRASVIDADTIEVLGQRVSIHGVDAPESGQMCFREGGEPWRCGQQGALALADVLGATPVSCERVDTDRYGRMVAKCNAGGRDVGGWLVSEGWAMAFTRYSMDYTEAEQQARNAKRGVWSGTVQPPWEWRKHKH